MSITIAGLYLVFTGYHIRAGYIYALVLALVAVTWANRGRIESAFKDEKGISHTNDLRMHLRSISNVQTDVSNRERINRWKCAMRMFADQPIFGFGPGTYQFCYGKYQIRAEMTRISTFSGNKGHAHSEYLNVLSESGAPGLLIFSLLIGSGIFFAHRLGGGSRYLVAGLITFAVHGFFNGFLEFEKVAMPVFGFLAAIVCLNRRQAVQKSMLLNNEQQSGQAEN